MLSHHAGANLSAKRTMKGSFPAKSAKRLDATLTQLEHSPARPPLSPGHVSATASPNLPPTRQHLLQQFQIETIQGNALNNVVDDARLGRHVRGNALKRLFSISGECPASIT